MVDPAIVAGGVSTFGDYPIVQFFVGIVVLFTGLALWLRGERAKQRRGPPVVNELYFDGPVNEILKELKRLGDAAEQLPEAARLIFTLREELHKRIETSRHEERDRLHEQVFAGIDRDIDELRKTISQLQADIARTQGQIQHLLSGRGR